MGCSTYSEGTRRPALQLVLNLKAFPRKNYAFLERLGICLLVVALGSIAVAGTSSIGIHEVSRVTFVVPVKAGTVDLPAGEYVVRHTMVGHAHVTVLLRVHSKDEFEVKCTLVPLTQKADKDQSIYLSAGRSGKR
jgi:hypothetical protein